MSGTVGFVLVVLLVLVVMFFFRRKPGKKRRGTRQSVKRVHSEPAATSTSPPEPPDDRKVPPELEAFQLIAMDDIEPAAFAQLEQITSSKPQPHPLFNSMTRALEEPEEIAAAVGNEPALAASLLGIVNSAAFALTTPISSIRHAVSYLGVSYVRGLLAQSALEQSLPVTTSDPAQEAVLVRLWQASQVSGAATFLVAQQLGLTHPSVVSTQALLSNLGNIAIVTSRADLVPLYSAGDSLLQRTQKQQSLVGVNAAHVGYLLATHWQLPADITQGLRDSLRPLLPPPTDDLQTTAWQRVLVSYLGCRIGDAVAIRGIRDIGAIDFRDASEADYFYLPEHLDAAGLGQFWRLLQDPAVKRKLNQLIGVMGS
jgi:HD-like signal output (HDOD) protein